MELVKMIEPAGIVLFWLAAAACVMALVALARQTILLLKQLAITLAPLPRITLNLNLMAIKVETLSDDFRHGRTRFQKAAKAIRNLGKFMALFHLQKNHSA